MRPVRIEITRRAYYENDSEPRYRGTLIGTCPGMSFNDSSELKYKVKLDHNVDHEFDIDIIQLDHIRILQASKQHTFYKLSDQKRAICSKCGIERYEEFRDPNCTSVI